MVACWGGVGPLKFSGTLKVFSCPSSLNEKVVMIFL